MEDNQYRVLTEKGWINAGENYEMEYWTQKLKVTREQLKTAIKAVGDSPAEVEKYLNAQLQSPVT